MRFFKSHPALSALLALVMLGAVSGAAYAVVREVWVNVDPDKSAPEIEQDVTSQLQQQGVTAQVQADKQGDQLELRIMSGSDMGSDVHVHVAGAGDDGKRHTLSRALSISNGDDVELDSETIEKVASSPEMIAALKADYASDDELAAAIRTVLAHQGYTDIDVRVVGEDIGVTIKALPARP